MSDPRGFRPTPPDVPVKAPDEPPGWFDRPENVRRLKRLAVVVVLAFFVADFFIHYHTTTGLENLPGFWILFGFVAAVLLIIGSKAAGKILKREGDYYDG